MKKILTILLILCFSQGWCNKKIASGFEALSIFDYFKAKALFNKSLNKKPAEASFGLAIIYYRTDNPFSNIDSACKYIAKCRSQFKDTITYSHFHINLNSLNSLSKNIVLKGFDKYCREKNTNQLTHYLSHFYFASDSILQSVYFYRDEIELSNAQIDFSSKKIREFIENYPQSKLQSKAYILFNDFEYAEQTPTKSKTELQHFLKHFAKNPNMSDAEEKLLTHVKEFHSSDSMYQFIKNYSTIQTKEIAWKLLYSLSVKNYSKEELTHFLNSYPDYPYNESLLKEIQLSQTILLPQKNGNEKYGYIDTLGVWTISPQYDDALPFSEGFASVCLNDTCFYINKEGNKASLNYFEEAESYKDGIAIVKKNSNYYLINRSGQIMTQAYQDINESSEKLFVCKLNNVYGAINHKGEIIIPFIYNKLGNFKNKYAYYMSSQFGLVGINNNALQAQWDWISDVDTNYIAIVKKKNQFGLMTIYEQLILPTEYDYIAHCQNEIYIVVKNNLYGFYNSKEKCFVTDVSFDYNKSLEPNYYTNGKFYKLLLDEEVALVDANGRMSISFGIYTNVFFAQNEVIRIQKNKKFGFIDRKLKSITPLEFDNATDFYNERSIVTKGLQSSIIDKTGKAIYTLKNADIKMVENNLFSIAQNGLLGLVDKDGQEILAIEFDNIICFSKQLYHCTKGNEQFLFNLNTKSIKKL